MLHEDSDDVDRDLEVAIEEEQNCVDVAEVCVSLERYVDVYWQGKEVRLLKDEEKKVLKRLSEVMLISEKTQFSLLRKVNEKRKEPWWKSIIQENIAE